MIDKNPQQIFGSIRFLAGPLLLLLHFISPSFPLSAASLILPLSFFSVMVERLRVAIVSVAVTRAAAAAATANATVRVVTVSVQVQYRNCLHITQNYRLIIIIVVVVEQTRLYSIIQ